MNNCDNCDKESKTFEIITESGNSFRYKTDKYDWQYGLESGSIDREDKSVVEIINQIGSIQKTYTSVIACGYVDDECRLEIPPIRRPIIQQCRKCGNNESNGLTTEDLENITLWVRRSRNFHRQTKAIFLTEGYSTLLGQADMLDEQLTEIFGMLEKVKEAER